MRAAISWASRKQSSVALSSCEAEIMAASEGAKEAVYFDSFLEELGHSDGKPVKMSVDNTGARDLAYNPEHHAKSKHILRRHFFVREMVEQMRLEVPYVNTADNEADFFTKPLCSKVFHAMRDVIMNVPLSQRENDKSLKAYLATRRSPPKWVDPSEWSSASESPEALWERLFSEYGGASLPDASQVPDGTAQSVYWVDGSTIVRVNRNGVWGYRVDDESVYAPGSVRGGHPVLSSDVLVGGAPLPGPSPVVSE